MQRPHYPPTENGEVKGWLFPAWKGEPPIREKEADESPIR